MSTPPELFDFLGIKASVLLAGLSGGILRSLSRKTFKVREMIASPICGALAAAYLTEPTVHYLRAVNWPMPPSEPSAIHATAFLLGVSAMWISDLLLDLLVKKFGFKP